MQTLPLPPLNPVSPCLDLPLCALPESGVASYLGIGERHLSKKSGAAGGLHPRNTGALVAPLPALQARFLDVPLERGRVAPAPAGQDAGSCESPCTSWHPSARVSTPSCGNGTGALGPLPRTRRTLDRTPFQVRRGPEPPGFCLLAQPGLVHRFLPPRAGAGLKRGGERGGGQGERSEAVGLQGQGDRRRRRLHLLLEPVEVLG